MDAQKAKTTMDAINSRLAAGGCPPTNLAEIKSIVDFHDKSKLECEARDAQKFLEAYETLTGVKRGDICAHADPNDDSLYTYKTYEEYENDAERWDDEIEELKAEPDKVASLTTELLTVKADLKFQKEVSTQLQKECDTEHIRFLDEQQKRGDDLCLISQALGIDYHGENDDIFKAISVIKSSNKQKTKIIKKLKKENEELKEELEKSTENEERLLAQQFDGMMERIKELKEEFEDGIQAIADALMGEGEDADALCLTPFAPKIIAEIKKL